MTYSPDLIDTAEPKTICTTFMNGLGPLNILQDSPTLHTPHFCATPNTCSKRMVTFGGGIHKVVIKLSSTVTSDQQLSPPLMTLPDIMETSLHAHTSSTGFGGLTSPPTLHGLSGLVTYVSSGTLIISSFLWWLLLPHLYSPKCTWTPCTSQSLVASSTLYKAAAPLHISPNTIPSMQKLQRPSEIGSSKTVPMGYSL